MAVLLTARSVDKSFGPRELFRGISISFDSTERTGLIGANGSGKSTLLKILAGIESPDSGELNRKRGLRVGYLAQSDDFDETLSVAEALECALEDLIADEHDRSTQASILMGKTGFMNPSQLVGELSGGWKKRLAIAQQLIRNPELLLLDEPTNHLDLAGIAWLEKLLAGSQFAFVVISHDRYFLENVTNRIVELDRAYPDGYLSHGGPYSEFLEKKDSFLIAQQSRQQSLASGVRREIEWLRRGAKARTTKAKGRIEKANTMMADLADLKQRNTSAGSASIDFLASGRETRKLLVADRVSKSLGGRTLFEDVSVVLAPNSCLGLLGPNGSGKSTLLRVIAGEMPPDSGTIKQADQLRIVRFEQDRAALDQSDTLRHALLPGGESVAHQGSNMHITAWAKKFLFRTEQLDLPVSELSGGEQARLRIAQLMLMPADVLILDEPTNDLDINTLDVLEQSLTDFPGAIVLVTHDRFMLDRLCTSILALDGDGHATTHADVAQWQQSVDKPAPSKTAEKPKSASASKPQSKRLSWAENQEWIAMESTIAAAEQAVADAELSAADPSLVTDHKRMHAAYDKLAVAKAKVDALYARWGELEKKQM